MKIRTGFVSNSSSSSFLIAFPKGTEINYDSVAAALFPNQKAGTQTFDHYSDTILQGVEVARIATESLSSEDANVVTEKEGWGDEKKITRH